ncbi:MAG: hypothetical protein ACSLFI_00415 [Solirubrobacterales bacterium]
MSFIRYRVGRITGILLATFVALMVATAGAEAAGEFEPNDSRGTPAGPMVPGSTINATIETHHDSDWYKFYVAAPNTVVKFTVTRTNGVNEKFGSEFVFANGDLVTYKGLEPGTNSAELTSTVQPGKYFTWVYGNPDTDASGLTYSVKFTQGLSTFQAISSGCTTAQGQLPALTAAVNSATTAVTAKTSALAKANKAAANAKKSLASAKKKPAKTAKSKKAKANAIAKAKKAVAKTRKSVAQAKAALAQAKAQLASAQADLAEAQANSDQLCSVEE